MKREEPKVALVVQACDRYKLLFKGFEHFFQKHWPETDEINLYFLTEVEDLSSARFANIKTGKAEWSDRLRTGLQQLSETWVIYAQEDMWFSKPVDAKLLRDILEFIVAENPLLLKLHSAEVYQTSPTGKIVGGLQVAKVDNAMSKYLMSHQVSAWNREFLISQLPRNEHPWRNERKATGRLKKLGPPILQMDFFAANGKPPNNHNVSEEFRSEYQAVSVNGMLSENALPFIEEVINSEDTELSAYGSRLKHHFVNRMTHDGLPKPKKTNLFRRCFSFGK